MEELIAKRGFVGTPAGVPGTPGPECAKISGKEKTHKHKQICGIVPGLRGCQKVVYVFFFGSFFMGEENT